jgi:geranylgeranyl diphosphate synthase type II
MNFETRDDVAIPEYLEMIRLKTAVLIACSVKLGAILAGANTSDARTMYQFGENLGMAFQLQDDYLDVFGDPSKFGKQPGGDILTRKKTYLYLNACENTSNEDQTLLKELFSTDSLPDQEKVSRVTDLYRRSGVDRNTAEVIQRYTRQALDSLLSLDHPEARMTPLKNMVNLLLEREF